MISFLQTEWCFCVVGGGFTWVVHNVCGHPLRGDISWYGDLLSSERNLEDRGQWFKLLTTRKPRLPFQPHDSNQQQSAKFTLQPQYDHDATVNSYQEDFYHIYHLIGCWYIPHQGTPHWPATLLVMSSPPWLYGQIKNIFILTLHYKPLLLIRGHWHMTLQPFLFEWSG